LKETADLGGETYSSNVVNNIVNFEKPADQPQSGIQAGKFGSKNAKVCPEIMKRTLKKRFWK